MNYVYVQVSDAYPKQLRVERDEDGYQFALFVLQLFSQVKVIKSVCVCVCVK